MYLANLHRLPLGLLLLFLSLLIACGKNMEPTGNSKDKDPADSNSIASESYDESQYAKFIELGDHYQFPLDENGWAKIKPGSIHKKIYVSSSSGSDSNDGLTPSTALQSFQAAFSKTQSPSSDWILLKRGDSFETLSRLREFSGESAEHPILIGAYGEGDRPTVIGDIRLWDSNQHIALLDLHFKFEGRYCLDVLGSTTNLFIENVVTEGCESRIQGPTEAPHRGVTLRRVQILDAHYPEPKDGAPDWTAVHANRISGIYISNTNSLLIEESFADMNGWQEGYDPDAGAGPQPPSKYSHNFYLQSSNQNIIFRGNVSARGASYGAQIRPGGIVQKNIFIANNAAFFTAGDHPSLSIDNVISIAGNKKALEIGALGWGLSAQDIAGTHLIRNIVAHSLDPLDSSGPDYANGAIANTDGAVLSDNIVYNWGSSANEPQDSSALVRPNETSILDYSRKSPEASPDLASFLEEFRRRDRHYWPAHLTATEIQKYFASGF